MFKTLNIHNKQTIRVNELIPIPTFSSQEENSNYRPSVSMPLWVGACLIGT